MHRFLLEMVEAVGRPGLVVDENRLGQQRHNRQRLQNGLICGALGLRAMAAQGAQLTARVSAHVGS